MQLSHLLGDCLAWTDSGSVSLRELFASHTFFFSLSLGATHHPFVLCCHSTHLFAEPSPPLLLLLLRCRHVLSFAIFPASSIAARNVCSNGEMTTGVAAVFRASFVFFLAPSHWECRACPHHDEFRIGGKCSFLNDESFKRSQ